VVAEELMSCAANKDRMSLLTGALSGQRAKEAHMKKFVRGAVLVAGLVVLTVGATALATPIVGVQGTDLAVGAFENIEAKTLTPEWQARIDTKGATDVYVVENKIAPGGTFGWHSHPGPSIVIVKSGELTLYRGDDPTCTPTRVPAGSGFVDDGGDVHLVRNEGTVETVVYVTSLVPKGAARRIDEPSPGNCPF
jgi:quercetin dioxygenase-like cupin family protein